MAGIFGRPLYEEEDDEEDDDDEELDEDNEESQDEQEEQEEQNEESEEDGEDEDLDEQEKEKKEKERKKKEKEKKEKEKIEKGLKSAEGPGSWVNTSKFPWPLPLLKPHEFWAVTKGRKYKEFLPRIATILAKWGAAVVRYFSQLFSTISPALPYIGYACLILIAVMVVIGVIASMMPPAMLEKLGINLSEEEKQKLGVGNGASSMLGVKGDKFYGVRTLYEDNDKAITRFLDDYYMTISDSFTAITEIKTVTVGEETVDVVVTVKTDTPVLLEEGYSFANFDEETFKTENEQIYTAIKGIADRVYEADKEASAETPTTLVDTLKQIKYFGFDDNIKEIKIEEKTIEDLVADYVKANYQFTHTVRAEEGEDPPVVNQADVKTAIEAEFDGKLSDIFADPKYSTRTEKLFIKDYVFNSDSDYVKDLQAANYRAYIFMPKQDVTFNYYSFYVLDADNSQLKMTLSANGSEVALSGKEDLDPSMWLYKSGENLNISASAYDYVALENADSSIRDLVGTDNEGLLTTNEDGAYTWNYQAKDGVILSVDNPDQTNISVFEFETQYK